MAQADRKLDGPMVPRPEHRSNVTVEASYFVGLREQCRAVSERYATEVEFMQALYDYFGEYGAEPLLYMPGEGVLLRRVGAKESNLVRRAMIRFTCTCGHTSVSSYFTFDKPDLPDVTLRPQNRAASS